MNTLNAKHLLQVLLSVSLMMVVSSQVFAIGTPSGTPVDNTATIGYSVGGVSQPPVASDDPNQPGANDATRFIVDTKIDFTVVWQDASSVPVAPGQDGVTPIPNPPQVLEFLVTNLGNAPTQDFVLTAEDLLGDDFDPTAVSIFVDTNGDGDYDPGVDIDTFIDELSSTNLSNTETVFIVGSIGAQTNGQTSDTALIATAHDGGGAAALGVLTAEDTGADVLLGAAQVVFAEGAGTATGDAATDGVHSDTGTYIVSVTITVNKTSQVTSDGVGGTAPNAKAIPGATVQYTIAITNNGATAATGIGGTDPIDTTNLTFVLPSTVAFDAGCGGATSSSFTSPTLTFSVGTIAAAATCNVTFDVTIN